MPKPHLLALIILLLAIGCEARAQTAVVDITAVATPVADLRPGTHTVTFEYVADEMITLWHTTSPDFLFDAWDVFTWTPATVTFSTEEPVTLYVEGFGCPHICGKMRNVEIQTWPPPSKIYLPFVSKS